MNNYRKWISTLAVAVAIIVVLYYTGVLHSKVTVGIALTSMSAMLVFSVLYHPHRDE
jgi:hypothetical protein